MNQFLFLKILDLMMLKILMPLFQKINGSHLLNLQLIISKIFFKFNFKKSKNWQSNKICNTMLHHCVRLPQEGMPFLARWCINIVHLPQHLPCVDHVSLLYDYFPRGDASFTAVLQILRFTSSSSILNSSSSSSIVF